MSLTIAAFLFGFLAGFAILRLGRRKPLTRWEQRTLRPLAWVLMAASFTFAAVLLGWAMFGAA